MRPRGRRSRPRPQPDRYDYQPRALTPSERAEAFGALEVAGALSRDTRISLWELDEAGLIKNTTVKARLASWTLPRLVKDGELLAERSRSTPKGDEPAERPSYWIPNWRDGG